MKIAGNNVLRIGVGSKNMKLEAFDMGDKSPKNREKKKKKAEKKIVVPISTLSLANSSKKNEGGPQL